MRKVEWANALRGLAAFTVLGFHLCVLFWVAQDTGAAVARRAPLYHGSAGAPWVARQLGDVPLEFGAFGVVLFFLLSGFVIAISLDRYSRRAFAVARCLRVLPTYACGYLVTCTVIWVVSDPNHELSAASIAAGAVPGLKFLVAHPAPDDGIVWTLVVELVFYAVCLVGYRALTRRWEAIAAAAGACAAFQWIVVSPGAVAGSPLGGLRFVLLLACPFLPLMLIGVTLSAVSRGRLRGRAAAVLVPALAGLNLWLLGTSHALATTTVYRRTIVVAVIVFVAAWRLGGRWRGHQLADRAADISYPLYVVHPVLGYAVLSSLAARGVNGELAMLAGIGAAVAAATLLHVVVERPTHRLGRHLAHRLDGAPRALAEPAPSVS